MSRITSTSVNEFRNDVVRKVHGGSAWLKVLGAVLIVAGLLAIALPVAATIEMTMLIGALLIVTGVLQCFLSVKSFSWGHFIVTVVVGGAMAAAGVFILWNPIDGAVDLTIALSALFVVQGMFQLALAFHLSRRQHEANAKAATQTLAGVSGWPAQPQFATTGWTAFSGAASLVLGALLVLTLPGSAAWAVGTLVGVNFIFAGCSTWALSSCASLVLSGPGRTANP